MTKQPITIDSILNAMKANGIELPQLLAMINSVDKSGIPTLLCDFYKTSHVHQYPKGTETVYSTWIPRSNKYFPLADEVVAFGFQSFIKKYLIDFFNTHFFARPKEEVVAEYARYIKHCLFVDEPDVSHIADLHDLGYLPLHIKALKEGTLTPIKVPMLTVVNTGDFYWVTNYFETMMSAEFWGPSTAATIALVYRRILNAYAITTTGSTAGVEFQGHDFGLRGMLGTDAGKLTGAGHLLSFVGTDTIPAISFHEAYYNANIEKEMVGTSIPATEHSVMCAYGQDEEASFRELITEKYPNGFISIVSDTWDFWNIVSVVIPTLKDEIMARDGKVVIRPDSGDPVKILIGDPEADNEYVRKGLIECLWDIFGGTTTEQGYKVLDSHIGAIYGDSITPARCEAICEGLKEKGFASVNVVYGIGSFTYQYNTRDTFGFAMKATDVVIDGKEKAIFKDPKTDDGVKKSLKGRVIVRKNEEGKLEAVDGLTIEEQEALAHEDLLEDVFLNGVLIRDEKLSDIRAHLASQI